MWCKCLTSFLARSAPQSLTWLLSTSIKKTDSAWILHGGFWNTPWHVWQNHEQCLEPLRWKATLTCPFESRCNNSPDSSIATRIGMEGFGSFVGASKCIGTGPLTSKPVTKQKRQTGGKKRNVEKGENMLWRWLRKLGWKRTEIAFGAVWLRL